MNAAVQRMDGSLREVSVTNLIPLRGRGGDPRDLLPPPPPRYSNPLWEEADDVS